MKRKVRILIVDDEPGLRDVISARLEHTGYECRAVGSVDEAETSLERFAPDVVLTDVVMRGATGLELLRRLKSGPRRRLPVVLMTAHGTIDLAVDAIKEGAEDFLTKPLDDERLTTLLASIVADLDRRREGEQLEAALDGWGKLGGMVGQSASIRELYRLIGLVASSDASALISGESGTGKEVVAQAIHQLSGRREKPFLAMNTAAIPESLIESQLFGHERGAFTGAIRAQPGCFEQAHDGTLFLDEIAEMPLALQPKLLRILEDGRVRRVGGTKESKFDVRVLAATNRVPAEALEEGRLREDLYFRLNVFELVVPPLRERIEDLPLLCHHFIRELNPKHQTEVEGLRESSLECLSRYRWPGNVRELRNVIERAVILARSRWIEPSHLPAYVRGAERKEKAVLLVPVGTSAADAERRLILRTLEHVGNNKAEAARRLGLDVKTIRNKLRAFERKDASERSRAKE
ncbi:MAG: sigma-54 dependent transcriptional regulator [Gemmatimonadota bacterium]